MQETSFQSEAPLQAASPVEENLTGKTHSGLEATVAEKQAAWEAKRWMMDWKTDTLGKGIDEGIKETVVAFNLMGFQTVQSCEGHTDHGMLTPLVEV